MSLRVFMSGTGVRCEVRDELASHEVSRRLFSVWSCPQSTDSRQAAHLGGEIMRESTSYGIPGSKRIKLLTGQGTFVAFSQGKKTVYFCVSLPKLADKFQFRHSL